MLNVLFFEDYKADGKEDINLDSWSILPRHQGPPFSLSLRAAAASRVREGSTLTCRGALSLSANYGIDNLWRPMTNEQNQATNWKDCFLREVRVNYVSSEKRYKKVSGPADIADLVRSVLIDNSREQFAAIYFDASHSVISYSIISVGNANQTLVHPREVYQRAVLVGATAIAVAHNHPSGNLEPSSEDIKITVRLRDAGQLLGITVLDHVIVSDFSFKSLREDRRCWDDANESNFAK